MIIALIAASATFAHRIPAPGTIFAAPLDPRDGVPRGRALVGKIDRYATG